MSRRLGTKGKREKKQNNAPLRSCVLFISSGSTLPLLTRREVVASSVVSCCVWGVKQKWKNIYNKKNSKASESLSTYSVISGLIVHAPELRPGKRWRPLRVVRNLAEVQTHLGVVAERKQRLGDTSLLLCTLVNGTHDNDRQNITLVMHVFLFTVYLSISNIQLAASAVTPRAVLSPSQLCTLCCCRPHGPGRRSGSLCRHRPT